MIEQVHQQFKIIGTRITQITDRGLLLIYIFLSVFICVACIRFICVQPLLLDRGLHRSSIADYY